MTEENKPACAKKTLPDGVLTYLETWMGDYGLDALAQGLRDICAEHAKKDGSDVTRLTPEERRVARLWGFMENDAERFLRAILDHGPGSGCK